MENNYDRIELLYQALAYQNISVELLETKLDMPIETIIKTLQENDPVQIGRISDALAISDNYLWGGEMIKE